MTDMFSSNVLMAIIALTLCASCETDSSHSSGSGGDRYPKRKETGILGRPPSKMAFSQGVDATDRTQQGSPEGALTRFLSRKDNRKEASGKRRNRHSGHINRLKRSYHPYEPGYPIQWPQFEGLNTWRASYYPIQRPYFVPMYGYEGGIPLYCPPCNCYHNPGTPQHNPNKPPYVGPTYLPPVTTVAPPVKNGTTMMPIDNRFGENDDDERPIWDNNGAYYPNRASTRPPMAPTRKPASGTSTVPPLVHKESETPKNINHMSNNDENEVATVSPSIPRPEGPSKCVWAIVSCCSTSSKDISYECFDQLGCGGPFWDVNPCDTEYAKAAIETALNYYNTRF
ncbi:uncharacterized protein LOC123315476 isoform X2 [Coccinella septempunctata]|uniref:uncharacterized protein LOC123315476 isoform X2 n=1 Tax=Coccinella septempunctata TaxID=41139 RepID=UPI001D06C1ED|nr:uncharacterized protein LOC123315476 isoform X2 [Coccinella septempunctata]